MGAIVAARLLSPQPDVAVRKRGLRKVFAFATGGIVAMFRFGSLSVLLALLAAVPALQWIAFGYMLDVSGRLSRGENLRDSFPWSDVATRIGFALAAIFLVSLPVHLLTHWSQVARLIDPASNASLPLRWLGWFAVVAAGIYLSWAWMRGGRLRDYFWPAPIQFLKTYWRPSTWLKARNDLWSLLVSLEVPRLFWLGVRGAFGTLVWILVPALLLILANREGQGGGAGLLGALAFVLMGMVLMYIPLLQSRFAETNRLAAMFNIAGVRKTYRRAPWAHTFAALLLFGLAIPLYLLKIETLPREATWLPCLMFVALMLPARAALGLATRRSNRRQDPHGVWAGIQRWTARGMMPVIVGIYMLFVFLSQYLDVHGLQTWFHQHAILVPVPFTGT